MASKPLSRRKKALTLVPIALLSGAWTASLTGLGSATAAGDKVNNDRLPDGTDVPTQAIQAPANLPKAGVIAPGIPTGSADSVVDGASTTGIPSAALSAYQRAAQIIDSADKTCHIPWELIAAIGRVESDHGRYGGNVLSAKGVSQPGIYGIELDGTNGTQAVQDTDGGKLDKDTQWDRAVGPMQFIPSTWQVVKVDADGDGKRNPQDIDDASLATAVYLCSGEEDLGKTKGQKAAVYRYNHSKSYVDLVLRLMKAYQNGDYTAVPDDASGGQVLSSDPTTSMNGIRQRATKKYHNSTQFSSAGDGGGSGGSSSGGSGSSGSGTGTGTGTGGATGGTGGTGSVGGVTPPKTGPGSGTSSDPVKPVVDTLDTLSEAIAFCNKQISGLPSQAATACGQRVLGKTVTAAAALIPNTLSATLTWLGLGSLLPKTGGLL